MAGHLWRPEPAFFDVWYPGEEPHKIEETPFSAPHFARYVDSRPDKDRSLREHQDALRFNAEEIAANGTVLVVGGGTTRAFERELTTARPDVYAVTVDPVLAFGVRARLREAVRQGTTGEAPGLDVLGHGYRFPHSILHGKSYYRPGAVAAAIAVNKPEGETSDSAAAQGLPFKDDAFDAIFNLHSVPQYTYEDETIFALSEIVRALKSGGRGYFYPFYRTHVETFLSSSLIGAIEPPQISPVRPGVEVPYSDWEPQMRRVILVKRHVEVNTDGPQ